MVRELSPASFLIDCHSFPPDLSDVEVCVGVNDDWSRPDANNKEVIRLEWEENDTDMYLNGYSFSDGTLRFIALATLLLQPNPPEVIIIDEPELGLHPAAINKLAELAKSASNKSQVIMSTQSANLVYFE